MSPISPTSSELKRRSTSPPETEQHLKKRFRAESTIDAEAQEKDRKCRAVNVDLFDEKPAQLLKRAVAITLEHVGFEGASEEAIEALCSEAEIYAMELLAQITTSMLNSRRALPTPLDFEYALKKFNLTSEFLEPHLKPPVQPEYLRVQLEVPSPERTLNLPIERLFGEELSGKPEKEAKTYIPKHLPPFPSKHTFKFTEKDTARETDARKIREEAAHQARQGEDALRRLTAVSKVGKEKGVKTAADKAPESKERHQLWVEAQGPAPESSSKAKEVQRSIVVNANSVYHRKGLSGKRKGKAPIPLELLSG